jgi:hypothetical protein
MFDNNEEVEAVVEEVMLTNDENRDVPGVRVTCTECDHCAEAFGTGPRSVRKALLTLREECPEGRSNWYYADDGSDRD